MYTIEEFDKQKTRVFKYILYKKRTKQEIKTKFKSSIEENMLEDIIQYFEEAGYINDDEYIQRAIQEFMALKTLSIKEISYKLYTKGVSRNKIEDYISKHQEELDEYEMRSKEKIKQKKEATMTEEEIKQYLRKKGYRI